MPTLAPNLSVRQSLSSNKPQPQLGRQMNQSELSLPKISKKQISLIEPLDQMTEIMAARNRNQQSLKMNKIANPNSLQSSVNFSNAEPKPNKKEKPF